MLLRYIDKVSEELDKNAEFKALLNLSLGTIEIDFDPSLGRYALVNELDKYNDDLFTEYGLTQTGVIAWCFLKFNWDEDELFERYSDQDKEYVLSDVNAVICGLMVFVLGGRLEGKIEKKYEDQTNTHYCYGTLNEDGIQLEFRKLVDDTVYKVYRIHCDELQELAFNCRLGHRSVRDIMTNLNFTLTADRSSRVIDSGTITELGQIIIREFENEY